MDIISKALEVAEEFPVFPCDENKRPVTPNGFKNATQDPDEVERLFSLPRAKLIAIPTGEASGVSVIDIDVRGEKDGKAWVDRNKDLLGVTKVSRTMSGGWHYYYIHLDGIRNRGGIDGCVDIRGTGGYVIHPSSDGYDWINDEDFAHFPKRFAAHCHVGSDGPLLAPGSESVDKLGRVVDGREKYMASLVYRGAMDHFREFGSLPTPQWMEENVWPQYESSVVSRGGNLEAEGRGITEFRRKVWSTLRKLREEGVPQDEAQPAPISTVGKSDRSIKVRTLGELRSMPPPSFMIADYLIENSFAVLYGAPASFKSSVAIAWALSISHGADWNGRPSVQGAVVYLAMEGQSGLAVRAEAWHRHFGVADDEIPFYAVTQALSMALADAQDVTLLLEAIDDTLGGVKPSLIVVDTLARSFTGADENLATDMGVFVRNCDLMREKFNCTVLVVHHVSKAGGMRGSSALLGAVDTAIECKRNTGEDKMKLVVAKQKDVGEADDLWLEAREVKFTQDRFAQEQSSIVLEPSAAPVNANKGSSQARDMAMRVLRRLISQGFAEEKGDTYGVPEDVLKAAIEREAEKTGVKWYGANWTRLRGTGKEKWEEFKRHNNELIQEA